MSGLNRLPLAVAWGNGPGGGERKEMTPSASAAGTGAVEVCEVI